MESKESSINILNYLYTCQVCKYNQRSPYTNEESIKIISSSKTPLKCCYFSRLYDLLYGKNDFVRDKISNKLSLKLKIHIPIELAEHIYSFLYDIIPVNLINNIPKELGVFYCKIKQTFDKIFIYHDLDWYIKSIQSEFLSTTSLKDIKKIEKNLDSIKPDNILTTIEYTNNYIKSDVRNNLIVEKNSISDDKISIFSSEEKIIFSNNLIYIVKEVKENLIKFLNVEYKDPSNFTNKKIKNMEPAFFNGRYNMVFLYTRVKETSSKNIFFHANESKILDCKTQKFTPNDLLLQCGRTILKENSSFKFEGILDFSNISLEYASLIAAVNLL